MYLIKISYTSLEKWLWRRYKRQIPVCVIEREMNTLSAVNKLLRSTISF